MPLRRQIALAFVRGVPHLERTLHGIQAYARSHTRWSFVTNPETYSYDVKSLIGWNGDGVIATVNTSAEARAAGKLEIPVVNFSSILHGVGLPRVRTDSLAVGRLAAEHLVERGFRRFAFCGVERVWYSQLYQQGFVEHTVRLSTACSVHQMPNPLDRRRTPTDGNAELENWLRSLELPVGLMAANDGRARMVLAACERLGLGVPRDVAIIGAHNDPVACEFCHPPLSSVARNDVEVGYRVAELLDHLLHGKRSPPHDVLIPPDRVIKRASTDVLAIENPQLLAAVQFVRQHIAEPFSVEALLKNLSISRRSLEYAFRDGLHCSPHEFITRERLERAKKILLQPEKLKLEQVAHQSGFSSRKTLNSVFQRHLGLTPRQFARAARTTHD